MRGVEGELDVLGRRAGDLAEDLAGDRRDVLEVALELRLDVGAADEVVVAALIGDLGAGGVGTSVSHGCLLVPGDEHCPCHREADRGPRGLA
jgi:hypothetical protein